MDEIAAMEFLLDKTTTPAFFVIAFNLLVDGSNPSRPTIASRYQGKDFPPRAARVAFKRTRTSGSQAVRSHPSRPTIASRYQGKDFPPRAARVAFKRTRTSGSQAVRSHPSRPTIASRYQGKDFPPRAARVAFKRTRTSGSQAVRFHPSRPTNQSTEAVEARSLHQACHATWTIPMAQAAWQSAGSGRS